MLIVVAVAVCLYLIYQVRRPLTWIGISVFLALALAGPVNRLDTAHAPRASPSPWSTSGLLAVPFALIALIVPPFITEGNNFANNLPRYSRDVTHFVERNERLRELNKDYDITEKLQDEADKLPSKLGGAATTLRDVGIAIVNSLFALITILVLTAFMLGSGRQWVDAALRPATTRAEGPPRALGRPHRRRGGRLRGGGDLHRGDRRDRHLHRAHDPRRALPRPAGRDRRACSRSSRSWAPPSPPC